MRRFVTRSQKMSVPRASALGPGVAVNIVLKSDQRTGRLTTGRIQDLLSRGDHPRGIKVRLQDGQIGRVQSLAGSATTLNSNAEPQSQSTSSAPPRQNKFQEDYRDAAQPPSQERSLNDYIKVKPSKRKGKVDKPSPGNRESENGVEEDSQESLCKEFPTLDSALIAAILNDSDNISDARCTLQVLATS